MNNAEHKMNRPVQRQRGALAVEAAFVLPVVLTGAMMVFELAYIGLTIDMGNTALERAIQQFRADPANVLEAGRMQSLLRQRMVAASHGYLEDSNIAAVNVENFASLDAMGGGTASGTASGNDSGSGAEQSGGAASAATDVPVWRVTVDIRKDFITPLPRLLAIDSGAFRYRYQQMLGYLPAENSAP